MRATPILTAFICVATVTGCADVWAQGIARRVANDLDKIERYSGRVVERGLDGGEVVSDVWYRKPSQVRVEIVEPADRAGELFIADGDRVVMWWPQALFGVEIRGVEVPDAAAVRRHVERLTRSNMRAYAFALRSESRRVAGHRARQWRVVPTRRAPYRFRHTAWTHARYSMPLKMELLDGDGELWYGMELSRLDFATPIAGERFAFEFPANAVVMRWDLGGESLSLDEARKQMNFAVKMPASMPAGHRIKKIVRSNHCIPALVIDMSRGATSLSLTQSRHLGLAAPVRGKTISIGPREAQLSFLGPFASITWVEGETLLTLTGNLGFPDLIAVAETIR